MTANQTEKALAEHQQRIWQVSERRLQETAARGKELLAQIEKDFAESARTASGRWLAELETRATETSHSTFETLFKSAEWYEKKIQTQMQTTLEKGLDQAASRLREKAAEMSGLFASELDHYSSSYVEHAQGQMQENAREAAERAATQIDGSGRRSRRQFHRTRRATRSASNSTSTLSKTKTAFDQNAAHMEAHTAQIRSKLESDARGFRRGIPARPCRSMPSKPWRWANKTWHPGRPGQGCPAIESQDLERQFQIVAEFVGSVAMDEHKQRLENASNSWLLTTVTKLNQQSDGLIDDTRRNHRETTEGRLQ